MVQNYYSVRSVVIVTPCSSLNRTYCLLSYSPTMEQFDISPSFTPWEKTELAVNTVFPVKANDICTDFSRWLCLDYKLGTSRVFSFSAGDLAYSLDASRQFLSLGDFKA